MTIRDRSLWLYIILFVSIAIAVWTFMFIALYHQHSNPAIRSR